MNEQQEQTAVQEINITPEAAKEIIKIRTENQIPDSHALRMGVKEGGCCGISYVLGFDENAEEADKIFKAEGITVYVDVASLTHLSGATLEFVNGPDGSGFKFDNPKDQKSRGCSNGDCNDCG